MRVICGNCHETVEIPQVLEGLDTSCPECGAVIMAKDNPVRPHVDTHEETVDKVKEDPEVKEYLKGIEADTEAEMKAEAKKADGKKHK